MGDMDVSMCINASTRTSACRKALEFKYDLIVIKREVCISPTRKKGLVYMLISTHPTYVALTHNPAHTRS